MGATLYPADLRRRAIDAEVMPFPIPEMTPPETKMYFVLDLVLFVSGTIYLSKSTSNSQQLINQFFEHKRLSRARYAGCDPSTSRDLVVCGY